MRFNNLFLAVVIFLYTVVPLPTSAAVISDEKAGTTIADESASQPQGLELDVQCSAGNSGSSVFLPMLLRAVRRQFGFLSLTEDETTQASIAAAEQTVPLGSTLNYKVTTGLTGVLTFTVSPLPLMLNASLDATTGKFVFTPAINQIGKYSLTFTASNATKSETSTLNINVPQPDPKDDTVLCGRILDANEAAKGVEKALVGATVIHLQSRRTVKTDANGFFKFTGLPPGLQQFDYDGQSAYPQGFYGTYRSDKELIPNVINEITRPVYLMKLDSDSVVSVKPNATTIISNPKISATLNIPANTVKDGVGGYYAGLISLSQVPQGYTPASLPSTQNPALVMTIQPMGLTFAQPVPISFANIDQLAPGTEVELWSMDHATAEFFVAGKGKVSTDGKMINTISGGVRESSWHYASPPKTSGPSAGDKNGDNKNTCPWEPAASMVNLREGCIETEIVLPPYVSQGEMRGLNLIYNSARAYPRPLIPFAIALQAQSAVPISMSYSVINAGGIRQNTPVYIKTSGLSGSRSDPVRGVADLDLSNSPTGIYPYTVRMTNHFNRSSASTDFKGNELVVNEKDGVFGAGWGLGGLERLHVQTDGNILLVNGDGSAQKFTPALESIRQSTFDADDEGWTEQSEGKGALEKPTHVATGGNPGGYISWTDIRGDTWYWRAPIAFLGNVSSAYDGKLSFDLKQSRVSNQFKDKDIILRGAGITLTFNIEKYPNTTWTHYEVPLTEDVGWIYEEKSGDRPANKIDFVRALASVTELLIRGEFIDGQSNDVGGLDNVKIEALPKANTGNKFAPPKGEYSTLTRNSDGTYTRLMKGGTEYRFNALGYQTALVDRNGNTTTYAYDSGNRLTSITDPVGKVTSFAYQNGKLQTITDPVGRVTRFTLDAVGNLTQVTLPDGAQRKFGYDSRHLMTSETDARGEQTTRVFDKWGRMTSATLPMGVTRYATASQSVGLIDTSTGVGTVNNPAPVTRSSDAKTVMTDGEGRNRTFVMSSINTIGSQTNAAGLTTTYQRDQDGNATQSKLPSGAIYNHTFDARGNQLSIHDQTLDARTTIEYEPKFNKVISVTDPFKKTTNLGYDGKGNLVQVRTPLSRTLGLGYNNLGQVSSVVDPLGTQTVFTYDGQGNPTQIAMHTGGDQRNTTLGYSPAGYVQSMTDPIGRSASYGYDSMGRVTTETLPGNRTTSYQYDVAGNLVSLTPPSKPAHRFEYNALGLVSAYVPPAVAGSGDTRTSYDYNKAQQLTRTVRPDGKVIGYGYDTAGRLTTITETRGSTIYAYSSASGLLSKVTSPDKIVLDYDYNKEFLTTLTWSGPIGGKVSFTYDDNYRRKSSTVNNNTVNFAYDADGGLINAGNLSLSYSPTSGLLSATTLNTITDNRSYNAFGELTSYIAKTGNTSLYEINHTFDKLGRIASKTETIGGNTSTYAYGYDEAGRLAEVRQNGNLVESYTYDANGNRLTGTGGATGTYDAQDRLLSYGNNTYVYSANGELQSANRGGQNTSYSYDTAGNLISVTLPNNTQIHYLIDGQNRRVGKKVNGVLTQGFLYESQLRPVAELDGAGAVVARFVYGTKANVPEYMVKGNTTYRILTDRLGSVRLVVNASTGAIAQRMDYDAWGKVLQDSNPGFQPFGFVGGVYDAQTGLVRFGVRDYDAEVGRWIAKDPIRFKGKDTNFYGYVADDPVNKKDISGYVAYMAYVWTGLGFLAGYIGTRVLDDAVPKDSDGDGYSDEMEDHMGKDIADKFDKNSPGKPANGDEDGDGVQNNKDSNPYNPKIPKPVPPPPSRPPPPDLCSWAFRR